MFIIYIITRICIFLEDADTVLLIVKILSTQSCKNVQTVWTSRC